MTISALLLDETLTELIYENDDNENIIGNIYIGRITNILKGMNAVFIDIGTDKNAYLKYDKDTFKYKIGDSIIVQVVKSKTDIKGAFLTTEISLSGNFMVIINDSSYIGVSNKSKDAKYKYKYKEILKSIVPNKYGAILRTEGLLKSADELKLEVDYLVSMCEEILNTGIYKKPPALLYDDNNHALKIFKMLFNSNIDEFIVDDKNNYDILVEKCKILGFDNSKIIFYNDKLPLLKNFFVSSQIDKALNKKVWLKSGGFLIVEETEACVIIDVNTGKYIGKNNFKKTILKTNKEACVEVCKQLRLKNLQGIIIIDFIDMTEESDRLEIKELLLTELKKDRIKTVLVGMTELGLMQLTRKKTSPSLSSQLKTSCGYCKGSGQVFKTDYIALKLRQEVQSIFIETTSKSVTIRANEKLITDFSGVDNCFLSFIKCEYETDIIFEVDNNFSFTKYELIANHDNILI